MPFAEMTLLDKIMMRHLLLFSINLTEAYDKFDLAEVSKIIKEFCALVDELYMDFSSKRMK